MSSKSKTIRYKKALQPLRSYLDRKQLRLLTALIGGRLLTKGEKELTYKRIGYTLKWTGLLEQIGSTLCATQYRAYLSFNSPATTHQFFHVCYELPSCFPQTFDVDLKKVYQNYGNGEWFKKDLKVKTHLLKYWETMTPEEAIRFQRTDYMGPILKTLMDHPDYKAKKKLSAAAVYIGDMDNLDSISDIADALPTTPVPKVNPWMPLMTSEELKKWRVKMLAVLAKLLTSELSQQFEDEVFESNGTNFIDTARLRMFDLLAWLRLGEHLKFLLRDAVNYSQVQAASKSAQTRTDQARCLLLYEVNIDFFSTYRFDSSHLEECETKYKLARTEFFNEDKMWLLQSISYRDTSLERTGFLFHRKGHVVVHNTLYQSSVVDAEMGWLLENTTDRKFFGVLSLSPVPYIHKLKMGVDERLKQLMDRPGVGVTN
jgi:hypothetical protein